MSPEVARKNAEWFARKKAQREARATAKAGKQSKKFVQPKPQDVKAAVAKHVEEVKQEVAKQQKATKPGILKELKGAVKAKWSQVNGLADATRSELTRILERGEKEPGILVELQETWAKRARARHEAWLKGDSPSAKATRERESRDTTEVRRPR